MRPAQVDRVGRSVARVLDMTVTQAGLRVLHRQSQPYAGHPSTGENGSLLNRDGAVS